MTTGRLTVDQPHHPSSLARDRHPGRQRRRRHRGLLAWAGGMNPPTAILTAGGAFAGTILLILTAVRFTTGQPE
ncbi:hypothetical protein GCM10029963_79380 [Micromonospora andamanensis]